MAKIARPRMKRRALFWPAFLPLIILSGVLVNWVFLASAVFAAPLASASQPGHNTFQQFQQAGQRGKNHGQFQRPSHDPGAQKPDTSGKTNLGQIWQAPIDGSPNAKIYLYCDSSHPHQLTGVYESGTCSSKGTADYTATYDPWGNVSSYNLWNGWENDTRSYDALNHLVSLTDSGSATSEQYVYDASGNRVLKRSTSAGTTTLTAYAFGLQELGYSGSGVFSSQLDY